MSDSSNTTPMPSPMPPEPKVVRPARVFSAIQPTGDIHIGNYLGAIRTWADQCKAQPQTGEELYFAVADAHAITVPHKPKELRATIDRFVIDLLALGVDPACATFFVQSDVPEHMELAWYLSSVTPMGDLSRMTQFKDKSEGQDFASSALFTYPVLMSADILLYRATVVPVGDDQLQHLELARETARRFNHRFGKTFLEPRARVSNATRVGGLDGDGKMSKSKGNTLDVFADPKTFWNKLKTAYTDPARVLRSDPGHPDICNIYSLHSAMSSPEQQEEVVRNCTTAGWGCFDCKQVLYQNFETELIPLRDKRAQLRPDDARAAMAQGTERARVVAGKTISDVRKALGVGYLRV